MFDNKFKITCENCKGENCYVAPRELFSDCGDEVVLEIVCDDCKESAKERMDIMEV